LLVGRILPPSPRPALGRSPGMGRRPANRAVRMRRRPTTFTPSRISRVHLAGADRTRFYELAQKPSPLDPAGGGRVARLLATGGYVSDADGDGASAPSADELRESWAAASRAGARRHLRAIRFAAALARGPGRRRLEYLDPRWPGPASPTVWRMKTGPGRLDPTRRGRSCANCWPAPDRPRSPDLVTPTVAKSCCRTLLRPTAPRGGVRLLLQARPSSCCASPPTRPEPAGPAFPRCSGRVRSHILTTFSHRDARSTLFHLAVRRKTDIGELNIAARASARTRPSRLWTAGAFGRGRGDRADATNRRRCLPARVWVAPRCWG